MMRASLASFVALLVSCEQSQEKYDDVEWCHNLGDYPPLKAELGDFDDLRDPWADDEHELMSNSSYVAEFKCPPPVGQGILAGDPVAVPLPGKKRHDKFLPVYRRQLFGTAAPSFGYVQLHGSLLDGDYYFRQAIKAAALVHKTNGKTAVVVAPVFGNKECSKADWTGVYWPEPVGSTPTWTGSWTTGRKSRKESGWAGISTFEALDTLVEWLEEEYQQLEKITLLGFSAGAMMGVRWAAVSKVGENGKTQRGTPFQIIVGSPSSPVYLNERRPAKSCSVIRTESSRFKCDEYSLPSDSLSKGPDTCGGTWDNWPAGLQDIDKYMYTPYTGGANASVLRARFASKNFWFAVGDRDVVTCNVGACKNSCEAMNKGSSRLQRVLNFAQHLKDAIPGYEPKYQVFSGNHAYFHMLCDDTKRPQMTNSAFMNAMNGGATAIDDFKCSTTVLAATGLNGNVIAQKEATTVEECCYYCESDEACKAFSFASKWKQCSILSDVQGQWPTEDFVGGIRGASSLALAAPATHSSAAFFV